MIPQNDGDPVAGAPQHDAPGGVTIRAMEPHDAAEVTVLLNLPGYRWGTMRLPYQSVNAVRERMRPDGPNHVSLVAVGGGEIVGTAGMTRYEGRRVHVGTLGMGVHDAHTGRGIGTALLSALLDVADNWWMLRRVELAVNVDNEPAVRLYEGLGFEREGLLRDYAVRGGVFVDAISMARLRKQ